MKLGICTSPQEAAVLADAGYDYVEPPLNSIAMQTHDEFERTRDVYAQLAVPAEAFNCFFPGSIRLTGPDVDRGAVSNYLRTAIPRAAALGGRVIVFGSGGSRRVPDGFPRQEGLEQVARMLAEAGPIAATHGVTIVVEPLRREEDNLINTAAAGLELASSVGHPNVRLLVDYYHMRSEGEAVEIIRTAGNAMLRHCHIARLEGRSWPREGDGEDYSAFFGALADIGYDGRLSVEGRTESIEADATASMSFLSRAIGRA